MWKTNYRHHGNYAGDVPDSITPEDFIRTYQANLQTSSLQIGELFMHVSSSTVPAIWKSDHGFEFPGLLRIWPNRGHPIQWPSLTAVTDPAAYVIADRNLARMRPIKG